MSLFEFKEPMQPRDELILVPAQKCMTVLCCTLIKFAFAFACACLDTRTLVQCQSVCKHGNERYLHHV